MLRITKESEYAFLLLSALLDEEDAPKSATKLAEQTGIAAPMTGKVLKRLVKFNILASTRGAYGGYSLTRDARAITALDVVEAMEGTPELVECAGQGKDCALAGRCGISLFWLDINDDIRRMLAGKTLLDMQRTDRRLRHGGEVPLVPCK